MAYLWIDNNTPIELTDKTIPEVNTNGTISKSIFEESANNLLDTISSNHPLLKTYELKIKQNEIDRKLKQDKLKPQLNFNYNPLYNSNNINLSDFNN